MDKLAIRAEAKVAQELNKTISLQQHIQTGHLLFPVGLGAKLLLLSDLIMTCPNLVSDLIKLTVELLDQEFVAGLELNTLLCLLLFSKLLLPGFFLSLQSLITVLK